MYSFPPTLFFIGGYQVGGLHARATQAQARRSQAAGRLCRPRWPHPSARGRFQREREYDQGDRYTDRVVCMYIYIYVYIYIYIYTSRYIDICKSLSIFLSLYMYIYVCVCVCVYVYIHRYIHIYTYTRVCINVYILYSSWSTMPTAMAAPRCTWPPSARTRIWPR